MDLTECHIFLSSIILQTRSFKVVKHSHNCAVFFFVLYKHKLLIIFISTRLLVGEILLILVAKKM